MANENTASTWFNRDYPVLLAVAGLAEGSRFIQTQQLAERVGQPRQQIVNAVKNLSTRYLLVRDASTYDGIDFVVSGLTADGLEAAGEWPSTELMAQRLLEALEEQLERETAGSARHTKLRAACAALGTLATDSGPALLATAMARTMGIS